MRTGLPLGRKRERLGREGSPHQPEPKSPAGAYETRGCSIMTRLTCAVDHCIHGLSTVRGHGAPGRGRSPQVATVGDVVARLRGSTACDCAGQWPAVFGADSAVAGRYGRGPGLCVGGLVAVSYVEELVGDGAVGKAYRRCVDIAVPALSAHLVEPRVQWWVHEDIPRDLPGGDHQSTLRGDPRSGRRDVTEVIPRSPSPSFVIGDLIVIGRQCGRGVGRTCPWFLKPSWGGTSRSGRWPPPST